MTSLRAWLHGTGLETHLLRWRWRRALSPAARWLYSARMSEDWMRSHR